MQKGFTLILILIAAVVLATSVGGIYFFQKQQAIKNINTQPISEEEKKKLQPPDETINWETYTNSEYEFSFKYPDKYRVKEEYEIISLSEEDECCDSGFQVWLDKSRFEDSKALIQCDKAVEEIRKNPSFPRSECLEGDITQTKLGNVDAISFYVGSTGEGSSYHIVQTLKEPLMQIRYLGSKNHKSIDDQILSTFEFLEASPSPTGTSKDQCGDGVCQEVVCLAIGCPKPETPQNCPSDCK